MAGTSATLLAKRWESALLVNVDNDTLARLLASEEAMDALMHIEGFRSLNADIETIINKSNAVKKANLDLTYAVRDGIVSHCGEADQNGLYPRDISIPVDDFDKPGKYQAATWEGCVVKMADKIAYVGRDIEDAITLGILDQADQNELVKMARVHDQKAVNTTQTMIS